MKGRTAVDQGYDCNNYITVEVVEALREKANKLLKELNTLAKKEYSETGKLSSPRLNDKREEYEKLALAVLAFEQRLLDSDN